MNVRLAMLGVAGAAAVATGIAVSTGSKDKPHKRIHPKYARVIDVKMGPHMKSGSFSGRIVTNVVVENGYTNVLKSWCTNE